MNNRIIVEQETIKALLQDQFPDWAKLPVSPVSHSGWDNRTFHLGDSLLLRFPSASRYAGQVRTDHRWLPVIAAGVSVEVPAPLALGRPGHGYPYEWSVFRWIDGTPADIAAPLEHDQFALDLAEFLLELQTLDAAGAPQPGQDNFWRGGSPRFYHEEMVRAVQGLPDGWDRQRYLAAWTLLSESTWGKPPVWLHGDFAPSNILVRDGRLAAVIDFGQMAVGDPACDYSIAWQFLSKSARAVFKQATQVDDATWDRAAAWALWKGSIRVAGFVTSTSKQLEEARAILHEIMYDIALRLNDRL